LNAREKRECRRRIEEEWRRGSEIYRDKARTLRKTKRGKSGPRKKERGEEDEAAQVSELLRMKSEPKECLWLGFLDGGRPKLRSSLL
jgi:hypothetical protein